VRARALGDRRQGDEPNAAASGHQLDSNRLWYGGLTVSGFNAGIYIPTHLPEVRPAAEAA
jgi:NADPH:quinone reductase